VVPDISLLRVFDDKPGATRAKITVLYTVLIGANVLAWLWAFVQFREQPVLLGSASLAYTFGLRHAVDPDHIAAIDNVTRKLMQDGKRPISAGFFFALGHSTVVIIASLLVALSVRRTHHIGPNPQLASNSGDVWHPSMPGSRGLCGATPVRSPDQLRAQVFVRESGRSRIN
jgi:high-affinity nickel permease